MKRRPDTSWRRACAKRAASAQWTDLVVHRVEERRVGDDLAALATVEHALQLGLHRRLTVEAGGEATEWEVERCVCVEVRRHCCAEQNFSGSAESRATLGLERLQSSHRLEVR